MKIFVGVLYFFSTCLICNTISNSTSQENKRFAQTKQVYLTSKKKYQKEKQNRSLQKAYLDATLKLAHLFLTHKALPPKVKYPTALRLYREVLSIQPKNLVALESKNIIESIYKSMNRPIPK